jgi:hypothetical protein
MSNEPERMRIMLGAGPRYPLGWGSTASSAPVAEVLAEAQGEFCLWWPPGLVFKCPTGRNWIDRIEWEDADGNS